MPYTVLRNMIAKSSFPDGVNDVTHSRKREKVTVVVPGVENGIKTLGVFFPSSSESFGILEAKIFTAEGAEKCRRGRKENQEQALACSARSGEILAHSALKRFGF